ncbi:MAG: DUF1015 domain-containing protein [Phycisphaerae bacterium]|jgi:uncharacterized protein (DUF1015 family)
MEIRAFRGWRYRPDDDGDVSDFIAPPYDILSGQDKIQLLTRSDKNIVAVDMPHVPPSSLGPDETYQQAARRLADWQEHGVLTREAKPALYAYEQEFSWAGKTYTRRAILCSVRATEPGRDVIPHEHTFAGPTADRLRLTQCTRTQLSPIFGFYRDPSGTAAAMLAEATAGAADAHGQLGEVSEKLWVIRDAKWIAQFTATLRDQPVFIADGHHRYATALNYRDGLAAGGKLPADHEANFVLFALVARQDSGLLILPTHRIIRGLSAGFSMDALAAAAKEFRWQRADLPATDDADTFLRPYGGGAMAFIPAGASGAWIAKLTDPAAMRQAAGGQIEAWQKLDVAILHKLIVEKALRPWWTNNSAIEYTPSIPRLLEACKSGQASLGVCLQATGLDAVEAVASAGASMPHKSTYFYPKMSTGWVLKPLE